MFLNIYILGYFLIENVVRVMEWMIIDMFDFRGILPHSVIRKEEPFIADHYNNILYYLTWIKDLHRPVINIWNPEFSNIEA